MKMKLLCMVAAAAASIGVGCANVPRGDAAEAVVTSEDVGYTLTLVPGATPTVRVTMTVKGEADGTSRLAVAPSWGGVDNCERFIGGLSVRDIDGNECAITTEPDAPHGWNVAHEPGAKLVATYQLKPSEKDGLGQFGTHYEPVVRNDLLHLIGETGFIYPEWLESRGPVDIAFNMEWFEENGWQTATSFDHEQGRLHCPIQQFRHAMFLAGKVRIHDREVRGGKLRVAVYGDDWGFADAEMADLIARIVDVEREFVNDFSDPYFLVTVVPAGPRMSPQSLSMGGTGLTNCFALFLAPGTAAGADSPHRNRILHLLAHEYFHTWNGGKLVTEEPEQLVYWFSEGFTEYFAARILHTAGLTDDAWWTMRLNETLKKLWLSPVATEPATTIVRDFWTRREVQELPYSRGEIVALMLDAEIRRTSGGAKSLDEFFLEVLASARDGEKASTEPLLARAARWTSEPFAAKLRSIVVDGVLPEPPRELSEPRATLEEIDSYHYDTGFDLARALETRIASGVREGSAAHAAGLRDGQSITGFSVHHGDPDKEIKLNVTENGETRTVKYFPRGKAVRMPRYRLDAKSGS